VRGHTLPDAHTGIQSHERTRGLVQRCDHAAARRETAAGIGLSIDWSTPEITSEAGEEVHTFWDPEPGLNASASLIYVGGVLMGVRLGMAL
jgi:hypothetical protein